MSNSCTKEDVHLFAKDANIGEATRSPTINAEDRTPSWKLFKLKSPLQESWYDKPRKKTKLSKETNAIAYHASTGQNFGEW